MLFVGIFLIPFMVIGYMALIVLWEAYVVSVLWDWYMVPLFHLPMLTISAAIGITCVANILTKQHIPAKDSDYGVVLFPITWPALLLLVGWLAK